MHTKTIHSYLFRFLFISISFISLLLVAASPKASAAAPCKLVYSVTADKTAVQVGGTITRTFTLTNTAKTSCHSTSVSVYYSPNESYVSSTPNPTASNYYWNVGTLNSGKSVSMTITTRVASNVDNIVSTESCASATGAADACVTSNITIGGTTTPSTTTSTTPTVATSTTTTPVPTTSTTTTTTVTPALSTTTTTPVIAGGKEQGIWIWNFPSAMLSSAATQQLKDVSAMGFNVVYITADDYIDIASMASGSAKTSAIASYFKNLSQFVTTANSLGLAVDAEGGWRDWAYPANQWKGFALIDMVKAYNAAYPNAKLRGFQYDVEPYLLPEYETNKAQVLTQYVGFIDSSVQRLVGTDIKFSIAIPHFYDDAQAWTPAFAYGGKTTYAFNHLLNILEKKPGSTMLLMSYRDFFDGTNGTRQISETEIKEASAGFSTNIIVSQETGNVDPAYVTYYGGTKADVMNALSVIKTGFSSYSRFGGTAVHYIDSFLQMK